MAGLHHDWKEDAIDNCGTIGGAHRQPSDFSESLSSEARLTRLTGPRRLRFDSERVLGRPAHQRRIIMAEQNLAETDRRLDLLLSERAGTLIAVAE
jgi:hypothetical protein